MTKRTLSAGPALALFLLAYCGVYAGVHFIGAFLNDRLHPQSVNDKAGLALAMSVVLLWTELLVAFLVLRLRGQTFADIGWLKSASLSGWLAAACLAALYIGVMLAGPLRDAPYLSDWSLFRIATGLGAGISAGICEEAIFRGFVMTQARAAGLPVVVQVLFSAVLFGLAHAGWGSLAGHFNPIAFMGTIATTSAAGALLAIVYILSRRSLMPVILCHAVIDLVIEPWLVLYALGGGFTHLGH